MGNCGGRCSGRGCGYRLRPICPRMARVFARPKWVGILDFETRFPSALERAMERAQAQA
ncbi:MAG: hypothetical protein M3P51_13570 [Chloroflexota bacterium]|nr:hypothetical protein [Chloroflexota bacterium]